ncbi:hypothetical protein [Deinococcus sp. YIM 77859]|uniref:hypothetical protein n=1 Tax=Deinococcus sp. YIM 77859 TaxID=1540221 RepID=UPI0005506D5B|nr:hypothetical protein [Deinococcus sp. YIM 77859]
MHRVLGALLMLLTFGVPAQGHGADIQLHGTRLTVSAAGTFLTGTLRNPERIPLALLALATPRGEGYIERRVGFTYRRTSTLVVPPGTLTLHPASRVRVRLSGRFQTGQRIPVTFVWQGGLLTQVLTVQPR